MMPEEGRLVGIADYNGFNGALLSFRGRGGGGGGCLAKCMCSGVLCVW